MIRQHLNEQMHIASMTAALLSLCVKMGACPSYLSLGNAVPTQMEVVAMTKVLMLLSILWDMWG